jgi:glycosyltransferase involved in cell wall biosynthesis
VQAKATNQGQLTAKNSAAITTTSSEKMSKPILSILTPSVPSRAFSVSKLQDEIASQTRHAGTVEHLVLVDNKARSIGLKRQALLDIARGEYIAFVDDDDAILGGYVNAILDAAKGKPDVITFRQRAIYNGQQSEVVFGVEHQDEPFTPGGITKRAPWHICAWRRESVAQCLFGNTNYGEDLVWAKQARRMIQTSVHIDQLLHEYRHDRTTTEAPEG